MYDVISANEQFAPAVQYAVGEAVVCDGLDEARKLAYHSKGGERRAISPRYVAETCRRPSRPDLGLISQVQGGHPRRHSD